MEIPYIGQVTREERFGWYVSEPMPIPFLHGHVCKFILEGYDEDSRQSDWHRALANTLAADESVLTRAEPFVLQYCREMLDLYADAPELRIGVPADVWKYVQFGGEVYVTRRQRGDDEDGIHLSLECNCDWEIEHGLQLVLRDGLQITKVGPFDGHVTNSDAFAAPGLKGVVYKDMS